MEFVYIYSRRDIEFEFIMVDCQNGVYIRLVRLGVFGIMVYRPPSNLIKIITMYLNLFCIFLL